uniref:non-specific serine/threonine protein kinase n=1 Tax=Chromera velia CCMP2878 TaxID=1169474 RepID=A0A0G4I6M8_9ALVE|eukprot:Cvel_11444.t1-p1 / transcript=Cvel_11444.t1 / gene=Cvel_11444 / organism=Chromera_velia_CCMP2878 / gene_product=Calcium-dependent protein kinase 2, putative / transcript_product=Calcium-dependent protein kinase 2, putative / location=Cvel_scaffold720:3234-9201(-) / protein_length=581 / sequence_SO=supercontig / SO=protein_coding / is_pseudo=false
MGCKQSSSIKEKDGPPAPQQPATAAENGNLAPPTAAGGVPAGPPHISSKKLMDGMKQSGIANSRINRTGLISDNYEVDSAVLGTGINGAVRVGTHKSTGRKVAIKTLSTENISPKKAHMLHNEVSIYLSLDHPNIAKLFEVYEDEKAVHLVMELCTGKELYDRLASRKKYSEADAAKVTSQMLSAINYCHNHRICHRDLKLENWVYANASENAPLKLIDFGFSRIFNPGVPMTAMHGTVYYVSPEVLEGCYNEECDIWSIGVIVYMLLSGSPPFNGSSDHEILTKIRKGEFSFEGPRWEGISETAKDFIRTLLKPVPEERPKAEEAAKHRWIQEGEETPSASKSIDVSVLNSIYKFASANHVKRAALALIAYQFSSDEVEALEKEFKKLDTNKSGTISLTQLTTLLTEHLQISESEARKVFERLDQNSNHEIHYTEFLAATLQTKFVLKENEIREAFKRFDVDKTGVISEANLRAVLGEHARDVDIDALLAQCPATGGKGIDFETFMALLTQDEPVCGSKPAEADSSRPEKSSSQVSVIRQVSNSLLRLVEDSAAARGDSGAGAGGFAGRERVTMPDFKGD